MRTRHRITIDLYTTQSSSPQGSTPTELIPIVSTLRSIASQWNSADLSREHLERENAELKAAADKARLAQMRLQREAAALKLETPTTPKPRSDLSTANRESSGQLGPS